MCNPALISIGITALPAAYTIDASNKQARYAQEVADQNAAIQRTQAEQAVQIGGIEEERKRRQVRAAVASQRAQQAAMGLDINTGSALDLQAETAGFGEADALNIRMNAMRQAWGFNVGAEQSIQEGRAARVRAKNQNTGTILSAGAQMAGISAQSNAAGQGYFGFGG